MKKTMIFTVAVLVAISPNVFAAIENMPDIGTFNWDSGDDFSDLNYSLSNWDLDIPSAITFGINADEEYGCLKAGWTSSYVDGEVTPTQSSDVFGVRADIRLTSLAMNSDSASYYGLGFDLFPQTQTSVYWGFTILNGQLEGNLLLKQNGSASIIHGDAEFDVVLGQTYNLAIVFDDAIGEYYLYLNGEKKTNLYFPDDDISFSSGHFGMYSNKATSQFEFDNFEFVTVPEPVTMLLMGLGGLVIRKRKI